MVASFWYFGLKICLIALQNTGSFRIFQNQWTCQNLHILSSLRCFNMYPNSSFLKPLEIFFPPVICFSFSPSILALLYSFSVSPLLTCVYADSRIFFFFIGSWWPHNQAKRRSRTKQSSMPTLFLSVLSSPLTERNLLLALSLSPIKFIPLLCNLLSVRTLVYFYM